MWEIIRLQLPLQLLPPLAVAMDLLDWQMLVTLFDESMAFDSMKGRSVMQSSVAEVDELNEHLQMDVKLSLLRVCASACFLYLCEVNE